MRTTGFMTIYLLFNILFISTTFGFDQEIDWPSAKTFYDFQALDLSGNLIELSKYRGQVLVVFNGATKSCPVSNKIFKQLQELENRYGESQTLKVITFVIDGVKPSGSTDDIKEYVSKAGLTFDFYDKIISSGDAAHPLYKWMKMQLPEQEKIVLASKIVVDRNGKIVGKLGPKTSPEELEDIVKRYF